MPIFVSAGKVPCIVIPPLPRYIFAGCCKDPTHCSNRNNPEYKENVLTEFIKLRHVLVKELVANGIKNFKVLDTCAATTLPCTANTASRIQALAEITAGDGVHMTPLGYSNLAHSIGTGINSLAEPQRVSSKRKQHFWRGFKSVMGANTVAPQKNAMNRSACRGNHHSGKFFRGGVHSYHPYRR
jgi:hypothetical protein